MSFLGPLSLDAATARAQASDRNLDLFLGNCATHYSDYDALKARIHDAYQKNPDRLMRLLQEQVEAYRCLVLPPLYLNTVRRAHEMAYTAFQNSPVVQAFLPKWNALAATIIDVENGGYRAFDPAPDCPAWLDEKGKLTDPACARLDKAGLTFDVCLQLMNGASVALHQVWNDILRIKEREPPLQVIGLKAGTEQRDVLSVQTDAEKGAHYYIDERNFIRLDWRQLVNVSFHEPHHAMQEQLFFRRDGTGQRHFREDANLLRFVREPYGALFCQFRARYLLGPFPAFVYDNTDSVVRSLAAQAYLLKPREVPALVQGYAAEGTFCQENNWPVSDKTKVDFSCHSVLWENMPSRLKRGDQSRMASPVSTLKRPATKGAIKVNPDKKTGPR